MIGSRRRRNTVSLLVSGMLVLALLADSSTLHASARPDSDSDRLCGLWTSGRRSCLPVGPLSAHGQRALGEETPPEFDAHLVGQPPFLVLAPGGQGTLAFDVQNTGTVPWSPGSGLGLEHVDGTPLGAANPQLLQSVVPVGRMARWVVPVDAPRVPGIYRTSWQMAHDGQAFGPVLSCSVVIVPHVEGIGTDYGAMLSVWIEDLNHQLFVGLELLCEPLLQRLDVWFGEGPDQLDVELQRLNAELERLWRELGSRVQQWGLGAGTPLLIAGETREPGRGRGSG